MRPLSERVSRRLSRRRDAPGFVAGDEKRRRAERRDHGLLRRNHDGVATMFEMFGKLAVGLSSSPVMAWNGSRSSVSRP